MFELIIADKAKQDIRNTLSYIKEKLCNKKAATELADRIEEEISSLSPNPSAFVYRPSFSTTTHSIIFPEIGVTSIL